VFSNLLERIIQKDVLLTESFPDDAETYCSAPYVARPSHWQDAHSGEILGKMLLLEMFYLKIFYFQK